MRLAAYWRRDVEQIGQWWYDVDKPAHVATIALALTALTPLTLFVSAVAAAVLYFGIGKLLVAVEVIPHGAHKPFFAEAIHWIGEMALCALTPALVVAATKRGVWLAAPFGCLALYLLTIVATPDTPTPKAP